MQQKKLCTRAIQKELGGIADSYTLITLLSVLQVTWNQVQGLTRVGSQLCSTLLGSCKINLRLCKASPTTNKSYREIKIPRLTKMP